MIDTPHIVQTDAQHTAVIRLTVPREKIQEVMGPAIGEVLSAVASKGLAPIGPVFSHHFRIDPELFDFEIGVPVAEPFSATGRVQPSRLPAATVARTTYHGPYEGLGSAWGEFVEWIDAQPHTPAPNLWECYVAGPESSPDPANWRTELYRPLSVSA